MIEVATNQELLISIGDSEVVNFGPDGRYALSGSEDGTIRLWEIHLPATKITGWYPF